MSRERPRPGGSRRRTLRRGRELRGPLAAAPVPAQVGRGRAFELLAHEVATRVTERAGWPDGGWELVVTVAPRGPVASSERHGAVRQEDGRWVLTLHRGSRVWEGHPAGFEAALEEGLAVLVASVSGWDAQDLLDPG